MLCADDTPGTRTTVIFCRAEESVSPLSRGWRKFGACKINIITRKRFFLQSTSKGPAISRIVFVTDGCFLTTTTTTTTPAIIQSRRHFKRLERAQAIARVTTLVMLVDDTGAYVVVNLTAKHSPRVSTRTDPRQVLVVAFKLLLGLTITALLAYWLTDAQRIHSLRYDC